MENAKNIRKEHLSHEATIKGVGFLCYIAACFFLLGAIGGLLDDGEPIIKRAGLSIILVLLSYVYFQLGRWFKALNLKAKTPGTIFAVLGLLAFPLGTLINGYILYLLNSKKGIVVFSDEYKQVIAATPEIKYKTPAAVWLLLGVIVVVVAFGVLRIVANAE
jgi:hypothetical protein